MKYVINSEASGIFTVWHSTGGNMLNEKEIEIIESSLVKGYDIEIQNRKTGTAILKVKKEPVYLPRDEKKKTE